jgi:hypothetical protein
MKDLDEPPLKVSDFPRQYRWSMVRAYSVISGVPDVFEATQDKIDAGFALILENRNLRRTHEMYLEDRRGVVRRKTRRAVPSNPNRRTTHGRRGTACKVPRLHASEGAAPHSGQLGQRR